MLQALAEPQDAADAAGLLALPARPMPNKEKAFLTSWLLHSGHSTEIKDVMLRTSFSNSVPQD
jgi:hypothetical protein